MCGFWQQILVRKLIIRRANLPHCYTDKGLMGSLVIRILYVNSNKYPIIWIYVNSLFNKSVFRRKEEKRFRGDGYEPHLVETLEKDLLMRNPDVKWKDIAGNISELYSSFNQTKLHFSFNQTKLNFRVNQTKLFSRFKRTKLF